MGDVLAGSHAVWELESDSVLIRYERGIRTPKLFQVLGERRIPHEAISEITLSPGKRGTLVLRAAPRPGADALMDAAEGQLRPGCDPYRLVVPAEREELARYCADELRPRVHGPGGEPPARYLVPPPTAPQQFKAYDGKAAFDGVAVSFRWFPTGASSAKWKAGDQHFTLAQLGGVEWRSPELPGGHLRLLPRPTVEGPRAQPDQDPASVVFGVGYGPVHESLPFAAAVLAALRGPGHAMPPERPGAGRDPAHIADRIRHLGELREAGLVSDEEFTVKRAQLLAEL